VITVLCYGDSNTWGYAPDTGERLPREQRWPGVLEAELAGSATVVEEGLNGRTSAYDDPLDPRLNGLTFLPVCLASHAPLDVVVLSLGTNDPWVPGGLTGYDAARGVGALVDCVNTCDAGRGGGAPVPLVVVPTSLGELPPEQVAAAPNARAYSRTFSAAYRAMATETGCALLDLDPVVQPSPLDGVHFDAAGHEAIGRAAAASVKQLLAGG
jgi:lysophospholipase L1-like esterase